MATNQEELLITIADFLATHNIPYMLTGAWSVMYYSRPRTSHDIDFVVEITEKDIDTVISYFQQLPKDYLVQEAAIKEAVRTKGLFTMYHFPSLTKVDFWLLPNESFTETCFKRRKIIDYLGKKLAIATAEDTLIQKLRWYRESQMEKDIMDAAFIYQVQGQINGLDKAYIQQWIKKLDLQDYYKAIATIDLENYL